MKRNYGSRRLQAKLRAEGYVVSRHYILKVLTANGLVAKGGRNPSKKASKPPKDKQAENLPPINVVKDMFEAEPGKVLSADTCQFRAANGKWLYVSGILDVGGRKLVGYEMGPRMRADEVAAAIESLPEEYKKNKPVFHTDCGSPYMAEKTQELLKKYGMTASRSRPGTPSDNQPIESFWNTVKREADWEGKSYEEMEREIRRYIFWYNNERMHSALGYLSPKEFQNGLPPRGEVRKRTEPEYMRRIREHRENEN
jgi:transposase InsO family protein